MCFFERRQIVQPRLNSTNQWEFLHIHAKPLGAIQLGNQADIGNCDLVANTIESGALLQLRFDAGKALSDPFVCPLNLVGSHGSNGLQRREVLQRLRKAVANFGNLHIYMF